MAGGAVGVSPAGFLPSIFSSPADDFSGVAVYPFPVGPFAGAQLAFDVDLPAFGQVIPRDFGQSRKEHYAVPFSAFLLVAGVLVGPGFRGCNADGRRGDAIRQETDVRVCAEVADEGGFVQ